MLSLLALASSACWGTSDFFAGLRARTMPAAAVVAWSQGMALVLLTVVLSVTGFGGPTGWMVWAVAAGVAGSGALVCFYAALSTGTMGVVAPVASLGVVVPVLLGILTGDQPPVLAWVGMVVAIVGVALASGPELSGGVSPRPLALACVAAVGFGLALFCLDRGARVSLLHTLWGMRATSVSLFLVAGVVLRRAGGVRAADLPALGLIGAGDLVANGLFAYASSHGVVSIASVLGSLYPVVTVLLARVLLQERLRPVQGVGVGISVAGVVVLALARP
ncbi:DMT family transporter [Nostocoides sp. HKS02]|uniref:DMT family transporter n=1 Tax=Nostocoides sp. HKS02 TaxID=1813880 RepID=UPI0012B4765D|nr:DMT family transporter [Tetrasphaera sp. HKS02]QGN57505.1 EamA family transporter [Tetrasphaera sp. HKS02]